MVIHHQAEVKALHQSLVDAYLQFLSEQLLKENVFCYTMLEQTAQSDLDYYVLSGKIHRLKLLTLQIFEKLFTDRFFALDEFLNFHYDFCDLLFFEYLKWFSAICHFVLKSPKTCLILQYKCIFYDFGLVFNRGSFNFF